MTRGGGGVFFGGKGGGMAGIAETAVFASASVRERGFGRRKFGVTGGKFGGE